MALCLDWFLSCLTLAWFGLAVRSFGGSLLGMWLWLVGGVLYERAFFRFFFSILFHVSSSSPPSLNVNRKAREQIADLCFLFFSMSSFVDRQRQLQLQLQPDLQPSNELRISNASNECRPWNHRTNVADFGNLDDLPLSASIFPYWIRRLFVSS